MGSLEQPDLKLHSVPEPVRLYESVREALQSEAKLVAGVSYLIRLGVPVKSCSDYIEATTGQSFTPQAFKTYLLSIGGVSKFAGRFETQLNTLPLSIRREIYEQCRSLARQQAPLEMWRRDPAVALCISELISEPCSDTCTITMKAKLVHDVLLELDMDVKVATIHKVLKRGSMRPDMQLLELYTSHQLVEMRNKASTCIETSRKMKEDEKKFEHLIWKDKQACIFLAEAISQGATVRGLRAVAGSFDHDTTPEFFQAFLRRYRTDHTKVKTSENRNVAVEALRALHGFGEKEQMEVAIEVASLLAQYAENVRESIRYQGDLWKHKEACATVGFLYAIGWSADSISSFVWRRFRLSATPTLFTDAIREEKERGNAEIAGFFINRADKVAQGKARELLKRCALDSDSPTRDLSIVLSIQKEARSRAAFDLLKSVLNTDRSKRAIIPIAEFRFYNLNGVNTLRITTNVSQLRDARTEGVNLSKYDDCMYILERLAALKVLKPPAPIREFFKGLGVQDIELRTLERKRMKEKIHSRIIRIN